MSASPGTPRALRSDGQRNREALLAAARETFAEQLRIVADTGEQALAYEDAWEGFVLFAETLCGLQAGDLGFNELASADRPATGDAAHVRARIHHLWRSLLTRAQEQGAVRPDLVLNDMFVLLWSHSRIIGATYGVAPRAWRRHLHLMLDAYRAQRASWRSRASQRAPSRRPGTTRPPDAGNAASRYRPA